MLPLVQANPGRSGVVTLADGHDAFAARVLLADSADRTLDVQYYLWRRDLSGTLLFDALRRAAERGVQVRLLLDDNTTTGLDDVLATLNAHAHIEVRLFNPAASGNEFREARLLHPNAEHGRSLYAACAKCHGANGGGRAKDGIPAIAGQHYRFILEQLVDFREVERVDLRMNAAASSHALERPQNLADVSAYVADLEAVPTDDTGPGLQLAAGQNLYGRACSHCHGAAAQGDGNLGYPRLAGQHYGYLKRQIESMRLGDRPNVTWEHMKLLESLTPEEIAGVAGYLARLEVAHHAVPNSVATSITASTQE